VPIDALVDPDSATGADAQLARAALENPAFASWFSVHGARECPTRKD